MTRSIFRKVALERLSSPEQLDQLMKITTPRSWLALTGFAFILVAALVWAFVGSIPTQVSGPVIFIKTGGIKNIVSSESGQIRQILVEAGDVVVQGAVIAEVVGDEGGQPAEVISPYNGRILEVRLDNNSIVDRGTPLVSLELVGDNIQLEAVMYVSSVEGKKLSSGMDVQLVPSTVRPEEFGFMYGKITSIGQFPATSQGILRLLGSEDLVQALNIGTAPIEVHIELLPDANTMSGFQWSSVEGPPITIGSGTLGQATIVTGSIQPIRFVFP
jgi:hypothetical protein